MTNLIEADGILRCEGCQQTASACQCDMLDPTCCPDCGYATNLCVCTSTDTVDLAAVVGCIYDALCDTATSFTCTEAKAVYGLIAAVSVRRADEFMALHAIGDDDDTDVHEHLDTAPGWRLKRLPCLVCGEPCITDDVRFDAAADYYHAPEAADHGDHTAEVDTNV